jgi:hypothetical protein
MNTVVNVPGRERTLCMSKYSFVEFTHVPLILIACHRSFRRLIMLPMDCEAPHSSEKAHEEEMARLDSIIRTLRKVSRKETMFHRMRSCHSFSGRMWSYSATEAHSQHTTSLLRDSCTENWLEVMTTYKGRE